MSTTVSRVPHYSVITNLGRKVGEFTVFYEFAEMREPAFLSVRNLTNEDKNRVNYCFLVVESSFIPQDIAQEVHPAKRTTSDHACTTRICIVDHAREIQSYEGSTLMSHDVIVPR